MTTNPEDFQFEVTLTNTFDARSPEDAVRQMINWLSSEVSPWQLSYRVQREHQDAVDYIDADDLDPYEEDEDEDEDGNDNPFGSDYEWGCDKCGAWNPAGTLCHCGTNEQSWAPIGPAKRQARH